MDTTPASADQVVLSAPEPPAPPPSPARSSSTWSPPYVARGRRRWTAALAAALLVSAAALGMLYVDDTNNQATIRSLTTQNESLSGRNQGLQDQLTVTQGKLTASQSQVDSLSAELQHPTLAVWNVPMSIQDSSEYLSSTVPDTFTYHLKLSSSGLMSVSILSTTQFKDAILCVYNGRGDTDWCMNHSGSYRGFIGVTQVNYDFTLAQGCAAYLVVITAAGPVTVKPDVSVTYAPASAPTGACI